MNRRTATVIGFGIGGLAGLGFTELVSTLVPGPEANRDDRIAAVASCTGALASEVSYASELPSECLEVTVPRLNFAYDRITEFNNATKTEKIHYRLPSRNDFVKENPTESLESYKQSYSDRRTTVGRGGAVLVGLTTALIANGIYTTNMYRKPRPDHHPLITP